MALEISELAVNTTITNEGEFRDHKHTEKVDSEPQIVNQELLKQSILAECKMLISDMLERQKER